MGLGGCGVWEMIVLGTNGGEIGGECLEDCLEDATILRSGVGIGVFEVFSKIRLEFHRVRCGNSRYWGGCARDNRIRDG
jgi:hypothetical protein